MSCCDCHFLYLRSQFQVVSTTNKMRLSRKNQSDRFSSQGLALGHKSCHSSQQNRWAEGFYRDLFVFSLGGKKKQLFAISQKLLLSSLYCKHPCKFKRRVPQLLWIFCVICALSAARDKCLHPGVVIEGKRKDCGNLKRKLPAGTDF